MGKRARLLGVPNFSEGTNERTIGTLQASFAAKAEVLNVHRDPKHNRSVFTLAAGRQDLAEALVEGAEAAIDLIDIRHHEGVHPHIGALDVCPAVWLVEEQREEARGVALEVGQRIGSLGIPVFLYGDLASSEERRERAFFRRGGPEELARRMQSGELAPDFGPEAPHASAGATLVTARHPLVAYNLELDTPDVETARAIAAELRESGGGLSGVRAVGLPRDAGRSQISVNVNDPHEVSLGEVAREAGRLAGEHGVRVVEAELVGLAPEHALRGYEDAPPIRDFDPDTHLIERRLAALDR
jgi:glutamate formiminotransferase/glutamate formiminotransferase/formiminotetrahydrofolate cyclodeaminase